MSKLPVIELFGPTVQGEGHLVGMPTHFLRLGGCSYRCTWCDSMHAVDPAQIKTNRTMMTQAEICEAMMRLPKAPWLTLTGGDPCMHKDLNEIIDWCWAREIAIAVETQGVFFPEWLQRVDAATFSPKGPSSEQNQSILEFRDNLVKFRQAARSYITVKPVVFNPEDLQYALTLYRTLSDTPGGKLYQEFVFQVGSPLTSEAPLKREDFEFRSDSTYELSLAAWKRATILQRYQWLVGALLNLKVALGPTVRVLPQVHTLLWPTEDRGR